jgi:hypothetical protein
MGKLHSSSANIGICQAGQGVIMGYSCSLLSLSLFPQDWLVLPKCQKGRGYAISVRAAFALEASLLRRERIKENCGGGEFN